MIRHETGPHDLSTPIEGNAAWLAEARNHLDAGRLADAIECCRANLDQHANASDGRQILAAALLRGGQPRAALVELEQLQQSHTADASVTKMIGDARFALGDEWGAVACYIDVLRSSPDGTLLVCQRCEKPRARSRLQLTLRRSDDSALSETERRRIPFVTETLADLYAAQGQRRLAQALYEDLSSTDENPRVSAKLADLDRPRTG